MIVVFTCRQLQAHVQWWIWGQDHTSLCVCNGCSFDIFQLFQHLKSDCPDTHANGWRAWWPNNSWEHFYCDCEGKCTFSVSHDFAHSYEQTMHTDFKKHPFYSHGVIYIYNIISYLIQSYHFFLRIANQTFKTRDPQCFENTTCFGPMTHEDCWNLLNLPTFPPNRWLHCTMLSSRGLPKKCSA